MGMTDIISKHQFIMKYTVLVLLSFLDGAFTNYSVLISKKFSELNPIIILLGKHIGFGPALWLIKILSAILAVTVFYKLISYKPVLISKVLNILIIVYTILDMFWIYLLLFN